MTTSTSAPYLNGDYLQLHPDWHSADSAWKAKQVLRMLGRRALAPRSVAEIGCGAAGILAELQASPAGRAAGCEFWGYEISPQALALAAAKANSRLHVCEGGLSAARGRHFDVVLAMDVVEHIEDYLGFLRELRPLGGVKLFHMPLDLSMQGLARGLTERVRRTAGHLHFFTAPMFLASLEDAGYRVLDSFYTLPSVEGSYRSPVSQLARLPRRAAFAASPAFAALVLGGCGLLVCAE